MRCEEVQEQLAPYVDGELPAADADAVSVHLEGCLACQVDHVALKQTRERVTSLPRVAAPAALLAGVQARLAAAAPARAVAPAFHPTESLSAFLDDELAPAERDDVREHIAKCPQCSQALVALDDLVGRVRTIPRVKAPGELVGRILEKIGPQVIGAPAVSPAPSAAPRRTARIQPISFEVPMGVKRFLAAASVLVFALGAMAFATPNTSSQPTRIGFNDRYVGHALPLQPKANEAPPPPKDKIDPEATFALLCDEVATAPAALQQTAQICGFSMTAVQGHANTWTLVGSPSALRAGLIGKNGDIALEDPANFEAKVPAPVDKVVTRSNEVFASSFTRQEKHQVTITTGAGPNGLPEASSLGPGDGLTAEYFALASTPGDVATAFRMAGAAQFTTVDATVDCWTQNAEAVKGHTFASSWKRLENFAVRWHGWFAAEQTGTYTFGVGSDDGALLEVDRQQVCGYDGNHGHAQTNGVIALQRGLHEVTLRYFNGGGPGSCQLLAAAPGRGLEVAPQRLLYSADRVERSRKALTLTIPRRSVVKVIPAPTAPLTIHVVLRKRSE